ncbi:hypothetical protein PR202_gb01556 [Eleusine coracana subsp. coracana]|uniref:VHS domain-containing protein n=1 Tax=Eleusine coracana subsp. coracana TaxID=191504 RepID=A0AAV5DWI8_ELECO|nr:hypothetical protein PR202_gb01556 [Eleusine coracana subsp. coracana]
MYPVATGPPPARLPAASRVDKATSHLLQGPDWAINLEICDTLNADRWQTKDVVKAVKKRLQNKDSKVQFFTLTHDMQVRDKALLLLDSWQEAFGGPGGKYPQYYWSYIELKCRSNQQKLMQFVSSTGDEELLKQGLEINDRLQSILAKHDAIASGSPLPVETPHRDELHREDPVPQPSTPPIANEKAPDEEDDDEFAQIARRKNKSVISSDEASSSAGDHALVPADPTLSEASSSVASNALVPLDSTPVSGTRTKEQDMIDLLSLTLYSPPEASQDSSTQSQNGTQQNPISNGTEVPLNHQPAAVNGANYASNNQSYPTNQGNAPYNNYVAPWAQTGQGAQTGAYPTQHPQYASNYLAPPWAMPATANSTNPFQPGSYQVPNPPVASVDPMSTYPSPSPSYGTPMQHVSSPSPRAMQIYNPYLSQTNNGPNISSDARMNGNQQPKESPAVAPKPYYMPDNLFGDLIDVKSFGTGSKMNRSTSMPSPKGGGQPMIGGKK